MSSHIQQLDHDLWTVEAPLRVLGLKIQTRTTIIRHTRTQKLWVHSPCALHPELEAELCTLGEIEHLVAPNLFHHLYFKQWSDRWPHSARWAPSGLTRKRTDLPSLLSLESLEQDRSTEGWPSSIRPFAIQGIPKSKEFVFYHEDSQTLICTDLLFYLPQAQGITGFYASLNGCKTQPNQTALFKSLVKDRPRYHESLLPLFQLSIKRISLCHHQGFEGTTSECHNLLKNAFRWLH